MCIPGTIRRIDDHPHLRIELLSYDDFPSPQAIKGEVVTRSGQTFAGNLAYDLDESYEFEVLDGKNNTISYRIPFRYIRSIMHQKITNIPLSRYGITVSSAWEKLVMSIRITMELLFSGTVKIQYTSYGRK